MKRYIAFFLCVLMIVGTFSQVVSADYETLESAGALLKEKMKAKAETVKFEISMEDFGIETEDDFAGVINDIFEETFKYDKNDSNAGDVLRWSISQYSYGIEYNDEKAILTFKFEYYTDAAMDAEADAKIAGILNDLKLNGKTEYEKISAIYNYVCNNVEYDDTGTSNVKFSCYAAAVLKKAVCQGYASMIYKLALESGFDCRIVYGFDGEGQGHGWNIVRMDDGKYYFLDATWEDAKHHYLLKGTSDFKDHEAYLETMVIPDGCEMGKVAYVPGDADGNGVLDPDDAIYTLYHVYFGDSYPTKCDLDFDADGKVDSDDAIYLLYHIYFPKTYILYLSATISIRIYT